jgi:hypothetical protein
VVAPAEIPRHMKAVRSMTRSYKFSKMKTHPGLFVFRLFCCHGLKR